MALPCRLHTHCTRLEAIKLSLRYHSKSAQPYRGGLGSLTRHSLEAHGENDGAGARSKMHIARSGMSRHA